MSRPDLAHESVHAIDVQVARRTTPGRLEIRKGGGDGVSLG
jgi:hypothetical protein